MLLDEPTALFEGCKCCFRKDVNAKRSKTMRENFIKRNKTKRKMKLEIKKRFCLKRSKRAREVAEALTTSLTGVYGGAPMNIIADRGMEFVGRATRTAMSMLGHNLTFIPADLHQSNLVERFHRTLTSMIRAIRTEGVQHWVTAVRMAVQYYNHKEHASTGHAPVELHLGSIHATQGC